MRVRRFSHEDIQSGFEGERRDRILRTYIRNAYEYHLSEIFYTVVNEYTDWERTVLHPINTRDSTVAALSDAQFVAPLVQTGDLFSRSTAAAAAAAAAASATSPHTGNAVGSPSVNAFFYVFDYQTKDGDYPQVMRASASASTISFSTYPRELFTSIPLRTSRYVRAFVTLYGPM